MYYQNVWTVKKTGKVKYGKIHTRKADAEAEGSKIVLKESRGERVHKNIKLISGSKLNK